MLLSDLAAMAFCLLFVFFRAVIKTSSRNGSTYMYRYIDEFYKSCIILERRHP